MYVEVLLIQTSIATSFIVTCSKKNLVASSHSYREILDAKSNLHFEASYAKVNIFLKGYLSAVLKLHVIRVCFKIFWSQMKSINLNILHSNHQRDETFIQQFFQIKRMYRVLRCLIWYMDRYKPQTAWFKQLFSNHAIP